jgi:hypothetical protein
MKYKFIVEIYFEFLSYVCVIVILLHMNLDLISLFFA